ncbi:hypothetical protein [Luteolibacter luteus]|uniref:Uncharacterized protein n=1 Tax=Luteolibacter luteus TaxID=2728835 RepID=A0A858RC03_9BACT|nr:hypothetical protein [Luteolibacter luteus]QJE94307.1 hypothetical protein HHL09_00405 [Luteolibacter luteus]
MRYRPFRSLTFWLGVPGLLFLLWAWADSMRYLSAASYDAEFRLADGDTSIRNRSISNQGGDVSLTWSWPDSSGYKLLSRKFHSKQRKIYETKDWLPLPAYLVIRNYPGTIYYNLSIPHWFLLLCYGFAWTVLMLFQWLIVKRIKAGQLALEEGAHPAS